MKLETIFQNYLKQERNLIRSETYFCYSSHLKQVLKACHSINVYDTDEISDSFYYDLLDYFRSCNLCNRTINKRILLLISCLKKYSFNFDFFNFKKLKECFISFDVINDIDFKKILNYLYHLSDDNPIQLTHKVAIFLLVTTGIRSNELLHIEIKNIDLINRFILLTTTKTGDERVVFIDKYASILLDKYIRLVEGNKYLLWNFNRNCYYNYRCLQCFIMKIKKECNINKLHPHMFRHSFATRLIDNHAEITDVSALLGHRSVRTTQIYIHKNLNRLKQSYDEYFKI